MRRRLAACAAVVGLLSGCGGGGGSSAGGGAAPALPASPGVVSAVPPLITATPVPVVSSDQPQAASPSSFETASYQADWGLGAVHASSAYALGATGQGITVAVVDSGVDPANPDLTAALSPLGTDVVSRPAGQTALAGEHGTWVASVIGAQQNGVTEGIAFNSTILSVRADTPGSCGPSGCSFLHSDLANATTYAVNNGARVINYSLGGTDPLDPVFQQSLVSAVAANTVLVFAAGNTNGGAVLNPAAFAATTAAAGQAIAVGAVDANNQIASFSAHAGAAAAYFLVAPGVSMQATGFGGVVSTVNGTSFAAPLVSGAAAVVLSAAPYLTAKQVVSLLLNTATPLGDPTIYGHGLLDLQTALQPQGTTVLAVGGSVNGASVAASATTLSLGGAFGNAVTNSPSLRSAMVLDSYRRAYTVDLSGTVRQAASIPPMDAFLAPDPTRHGSAGFGGVALHMDSAETRSLVPGMDAPSHVTAAGAEFDLGEGRKLELSQGTGLAGNFGLAALGQDQGFLSRDAFRSPFLGLAGEGSAIAFGQDLGHGQWLRFGASGPASGLGAQDSRSPAVLQGMIDGAPPQTVPDPVATQRQAFIGEYGFPLGGGLTAALQGGALMEHGSILDTDGQGGFNMGGGEATTRFAGLSSSLALTGQTSLFGNYSRGWTDATTPAGSLLGQFQGLTSQSMGLGVTSREVWQGGDRLTFSLSQPLRVSQGQAQLTLPVGRTMDGQVIQSQQSVGLTPSGREVDAELNYRLTLGQREDVNFTAMGQSQPGHDASAAPALLLGMRYRLSW